MLWIVAAAVFVLVCALWIAPWLFLIKRHLAFSSHVTGPRAWPIVGNALQVERTGPGMVSSLLGWREQFPDSIMRLWFGPLFHVYMENVDDKEVLLSSYKYLQKGILYEYLHPWLGKGLLTSTDEHWRKHRKILTPAFHYSILEQYVPVFNSNGQVFVTKLRSMANGAPFDVYPLAQLLTLDVICEAAMGVKINAQLDSTSEYVTSIFDIVDIVVRRALAPWYHFDFIFNLSPLGRKQNKVLSVLHGTTNKVIQQRKEELEKMIQKEGESILSSDSLGRKKRLAFLDLLLLSARSGSGLTDQDIREEVDTFMFEGHDTTSSAVAYGFYALACHPRVQDLILKELESIFEPGNEIVPTLQQLGELKYLEMVIKEILRLYPPVPMIMRKLNNDMPLTSRPLTTPAGTSVVTSFFELHRDPKIYPDPEKFDPERFLLDNSAQRHPYAYLPFSAGPRNCIGQRFAMLELKSIFAKTIWNFKILPAPGFEPQFSYELVLKSGNGILVQVSKRETITVTIY